MPNQWSQQDVIARVIAIIATALRLNPDKISPESRLFRDLNAESLDILDIRFQIEHEFGFKIDQGEIYRSLGRELTTDEVHEHLTVTSIASFVKHRLMTAENRA